MLLAEALPAEVTVAMWIAGLMIPLGVAGMAALWRLGTKVEVMKSDGSIRDKDMLELKSDVKAVTVTLAKIEGALGVKQPAGKE